MKVFKVLKECAVSYRDTDDQRCKGLLEDVSLSWNRDEKMDKIIG